jgi:hypothetical protein
LRCLGSSAPRHRLRPWSWCPTARSTPLSFLGALRRRRKDSKRAVKSSATSIVVFASVRTGTYPMVSRGLSAAHSGGDRSGVPFSAKACSRSRPLGEPARSLEAAPARRRGGFPRRSPHRCEDRRRSSIAVAPALGWVGRIDRRAGVAPDPRRRPTGAARNARTSAAQEAAPGRRDQT